jgi:hypothetical protein
VHAEEVVSFDEYNRPPEPHLHLDCIHGERKERSLREARRLDRERKVLVLTDRRICAAQKPLHCMLGMGCDITLNCMREENGGGGGTAPDP